MLGDLNESSSTLKAADLPQRCGVVPIETLGGHPAVAKFDHRDALDFDRFAGRFKAGQKPVHPLRMMEPPDHLLHDSILGDDAIQHPALVVVGD